MGGLVGSDAAGHKGSGRNTSLACDIVISGVTVSGKIVSNNPSSGATVGGVAGKLYTLNHQTFDKTDVLYTYVVYGGKSQTPANNTTDDVKDANGVPVLEINKNV